MKMPSGLDKTAATTLVSLSAPPLASSSPFSSSSVIFMTACSNHLLLSSQLRGQLLVPQYYDQLKNLYIGAWQGGYMRFHT